MGELTTIILAAGQGKRMKSAIPKVLHPLLGRPMLRYVIDSARKLDSGAIYVVVGFEGEQVIRAIGPEVEYVWQREQLGTGHAVIMAAEQLQNREGDLLVLYGDTPLLREETLRKLIAFKEESSAQAAVLTARMTNPAGYGRVTRNDSGKISGIVEDKDATEAERRINEVNTGVYCFEIKTLLAALAELTPQNAQGEYYLPDVFRILVRKGLTVVGLCLDSAAETMGPNDRVHLALTEKHLKQAINEYWMIQGVTIQDPDFTYIGPEVEIGVDTLILPGTFLDGKTTIGTGCRIGPHTRISDSVIGDDTIVQFSQVLGSRLGSQNTVGPFAYLRPGTESASGVKFGDFVEVKNCQIGTGSKVPHLTYLGDSQIGNRVNVGAGTITCNYDGVNKHRTVIEDGAFIGSNANLVAPVKIGSGATVGAGSTITKEVPPHALAIARSKQELKLNWRSPRDRNEPPT